MHDGTLKPENEHFYVEASRGTVYYKFSSPLPGTIVIKYDFTAYMCFLLVISQF